MINNIIRGPITSIVGLTIIIATVYAIEFLNYDEWIWDGVIGVCIGAALLFIPDKIGPLLEKFLGKKADL